MCIGCSIRLLVFLSILIIRSLTDQTLLSVIKGNNVNALGYSGLKLIESFGLTGFHCWNRKTKGESWYVFSN